MRIYPSWNEIKKFQEPLTEGENILARFLDDNLGEDWKIFIRPHLNNSRPDIVTVNPQVGAMIYTVKEGKLENYRENNSNEVHIKQVNYYRNKIIEQIVPDIGEKIDENKKIFALVQTGIYLHNVEGGSARELFNHCNYPVIVGSDD